MAQYNQNTGSPGRITPTKTSNTKISRLWNISFPKCHTQCSVTTSIYIWHFKWCSLLVEEGFSHAYYFAIAASFKPSFRCLFIIKVSSPLLTSDCLPQRWLVFHHAIVRITNAWVDNAVNEISPISSAYHIESSFSF